MTLALAPIDHTANHAIESAVKHDFHADGVKYRSDIDLPKIASESSDTDVDRARVVLQHMRAQGLDVIYCNGRGYFIYESGIWAEDENNQRLAQACHQVGDMVEQLSVQEFANVGGSSDKDARQDHIGRAIAISKSALPYKREGFVQSTIKTMSTLAEVQTVKTDDLDRDLDLLAVANGIVDLKTGKLDKWNRHELITAQVPFAYDDHEPAECPNWRAFLDDVLVTETGETDHELVDYVQRLVGYGITGHTSEQMFAVLHGIGANGKGVFTETLAHVFGAVARTTGFATFETRRDDSTPPIARLAGSRLVFASEGDSSKPIDSALIKRLTGQDRIEARHLYREPFEFTPRFLVILSTNHRPNVRDHSEGYWRRIKLIPFRRYFQEHERSRNIHQTLRDEAEGILAWAIEGARKWHESGLQTPAVIDAETQDYRETQDRLAEFIATWVDITGDPNDRIKVTEVWKAYRGWCAEVLEEQHLQRYAFVQQMRAKPGVRKAKFNNAEHFTGLRLKPDTKVRLAEMGIV